MTSVTSPVRASPHIHELLDHLHSLSTTEEAGASTAVAAIRELRERDLDAGDAALHDLMRDKFVALDQDKCHFLYQLALATGTRTAVEIGTSFGVSTIYLALAVGENDAQNGRVVGTEIEATKAARARQHWAQAGERINKHIELRVGDLYETLKKVEPQKVDLLLIDSKFDYLVSLQSQGARGCVGFTLDRLTSNSIFRDSLGRRCLSSTEVDAAKVEAGCCCVDRQYHLLGKPLQRRVGVSA